MMNQTISIKDKHNQTLLFLVCKNEEIFRQNLLFLMETKENIISVNLDDKPLSRYHVGRKATSATVVVKKTAIGGYRSLRHLIHSLCVHHHQIQNVESEAKYFTFAIGARLSSESAETLNQQRQEVGDIKFLETLDDERNFKNRPILYIDSLVENQLTVKAYGPQKQILRLFKTLSENKTNGCEWEPLR